MIVVGNWKILGLSLSHFKTVINNFLSFKYQSKNTCVYTSIIPNAMWYRVLYLLMLVIGITNKVGAQHKALSYKVHFQSDQSKLDQEDEIILNQLVSASQNSAYYEIALAAHTDADAGFAYNEQLSRKRADAVKQFLLQKNINPHVILSATFGERKPEANNQDEDGKSQNRRVEITLYLYEFNNAMDVISQAAKDYKQTFAIRADQVNTITGTNGTTITIPANSLVDKNGRPVKGEVKIELKEFLQPADAAFNHLSTISDGRLLESGGMFSIKASVGNQEVKLSNGATMMVNMPTINMQKGMSLFTAVKTPQGITEWKKTAVPFNPVYNSPPPPPPVVSLNEIALYKCLLPNIEKPTDVKTEYYLPKLPVKPKDIGSEPRFMEPDPKRLFSWSKRVFTNKNRLQKELEKEHKKRFASYTRAMRKYLERKNVYDIAMEKFAHDSAAMENEYLTDYRNWLTTQIEKHQQLAHYYEISSWNLAVNGLIHGSRTNSLSDVNMKRNFSDQISSGTRSYTAYQRYAAELMKQCLQYSLYEVTQKNRGDTVLRFYLVRESKVYPVHHTRARMDNMDTIAQWQLDKHPELMVMLSKATAELMRKQAESRAFRESSVSNVYSVALNGFGSFNCDRFYDAPQNTFVDLHFPYSGDACVSFYIPKLNGYITANRNSNGYSVRLPKKTEAKLIFVSFQKGKGPLLQITKFKVDEQTQLKAEPKVVTMQQIYSDIKAI